MPRKCSHCGNYGHNSRTCGLGHREIMLCDGGGGVGGGGGGLRLFGVQVHVGSSGGGAGGSASSMKKSYSMDCLQLAAPGCSLVSPTSSSSSSLLLSIEEGLERATTNGYLSDGPHGRVVAERKKGVPWSEEEHRQFLAGLEKLGKGDWRGISRNYVTTRTPTQVASHAQKFFLRQSSMGKKKRRSSLFDMVGISAAFHTQVPICENSASISDPMSSEGASTSLSLNVPCHERSERTAFDLNSTEEDDSRADVSSASGAGTRPFPAAPTEPQQPCHHGPAGHGHHCSPLDLELGMSLSTPSIGT
ncbi:Transcription factor DIVARICATA [Dichanthelium oligosanthes]|uniref:Transcription factor DIVARICATA n=1 Tax=Dichanthelium oligosanthes TaxID=888268 RepID=A0A1E5UU80_9POAL|nr:Transcription factor DIVARICATA [Dichanthelium oligosanthes]